DRATHRAGQARRICGRSHDQIHFRILYLGMWDVILDARFTFQPFVFDVADDADYLAPDGIAVSGLKCNAFAHRVLVRPIFARHGFVNDRDGLRFHRVAVVEETPADDRNLHGRKIVGGRGPSVTVRRRLSLRHNTPFDLETATRIVPTHG